MSTPMGLFDYIKSRITGREGEKAPTAAPPEPPKPAEPVIEAAADAARKQTAQLGFFERIGRQVKGVADNYIAEKSDELMDQAEKRAEDFRGETLNIVQKQALELLDFAEVRIDKKLQDIEAMMERRLQQEIRLRMRVMVWTLAFVLLMAIVSIVYVWAKQSAGLDANKSEQTK